MPSPRQLYRLLVAGSSLVGPRPPLEVEFDPKVKVLYVRVRKGEVYRTVEFGKFIVADFTQAGLLIGIEILDMRRAHHTQIPDSVAPGEAARPAKGSRMYELAGVA